MAEDKKTEDQVMKKAWKVTVPNGGNFTGSKKYVNFVHGVGVLDPYSLAAFRPDWVKSSGSGFVQVGGTPMEDYAKYFDKLGFQVEPLSLEKAEELREDLAAHPEKYAPKEEKPQPKAKGKAKAKAKEAEKNPAADVEPKPPHETMAEGKKPTEPKEEGTKKEG